MKISSLIHEAHSIAVDKGWHERPVLRPDGTVDIDRLGSLLLLIHTEIGEAWECFQNASIPWEWQTSETTPTEELRTFTNEQRFATPVLGFRLGLSLCPKKGMPEGMIVELADVVVRVCDLAGALDATQPSQWMDSYYFDDVELSQLTSELTSTDQEAFNTMRSIVDQAVESMRIGVNGNTNVLLGELGVLLAECQRMAAYHGLDLTEAVRVKMAFNRTRPYRHGGKTL
jgi:hypothetical protein